MSFSSPRGKAAPHPRGPRSSVASLLPAPRVGRALEHGGTTATAPRPDQGPEAVVSGMRFEPFLHFQIALGERFCVQIDSRRRAPLYVVGGRDCWLQLGREPALRLRHGDVVFLPRGGAHRVFTDPDTPASNLEQLVLGRHAAPGAAPAASNESAWSGGFYWSSELASHPLVAALPPVLHLRADDARDWLPSMSNAVRWMADPRAGGRCVGLNEMLGALVQHAVLAWLRRADAALPAVHAPGLERSDARLFAALEAIHARPAHPWSVDALAALCHMSRTAFSTRFRGQMALAPMQYLARWRIHLAARLLRERRLTLQQAADAVGYSTGAILARAYKREFGAPPSQDA